MTRGECLEKAAKIVTGDREQAYGSPEDNFRTIAEMWNAYFAAKKDARFTPKDVAVMMAILKIARIASGTSKADNWIDLAGYAACGAEIESRTEGWPGDLISAWDDAEAEMNGMK